MPKRILRWIIVAVEISLLCAASARAQESPSSDRVYNTKETNSLFYFCEMSRDDYLDCEFTQTAIRKEARAEDLNARLEEARRAFPTSREFTSKFCSEQKDFAESLRGRKDAPSKEQRDYLKDISDLERKDALKFMDAIIAACNSKSEKSYINVARIAFERDTRTCILSSNTYKQSFRLVLDPVSGARSWITVGNPSGPCGTVQFSSFVPESSKDSKVTFWKYITKKSITNRQGLLQPGIACKDLDENEYIFDWRPKEYALGCDYIKFSPL